jgi:hypothetical protein
MSSQWQIFILCPDLRQPASSSHNHILLFLCLTWFLFIKLLHLEGLRFSASRHPGVYDAKNRPTLKQVLKPSRRVVSMTVSETWTFITLTADSHGICINIEARVLILLSQFLVSLFLKSEVIFHVCLHHLTVCLSLTHTHTLLYTTNVSVTVYFIFFKVSFETVTH